MFMNENSENIEKKLWERKGTWDPAIQSHLLEIILYILQNYDYIKSIIL